MKTTVLFLLLASITIICGCSKEEEEDLTGTLSLEFALRFDNTSVRISPVENLDILIFTNLKLDANGKLTQELNIGNYVVNCTSDSHNYNQVGFQIRSNKTTKIKYTGGVGELVP